jgi:hypothetical protein
MSESHPINRLHLADMIGLQIQELHSKGSLKGSQPLLRIDNREQARRAPFQLDAATGKLHRAGCRSVPRGSRSALYGVWRIGKNDRPLACARCKPMSEPDDKKDDPEYPTDLLFGVLSLVNQFGSVLRERGQEYRNSQVGKLLNDQIGNMYRGINERERTILNVVLSSLDELASTIRNLDEDLQAPGEANGASANGSGNKPNGHGVKAAANGHNGNTAVPRKTRRPAKGAEDRTTKQ